MRTKTIAQFSLILVLLGSSLRAQQPKPSAAAVPQVTIRDVTFRSPALGREMRYRIILPAGYEAGGRRYPVLYLLHGLGGNYAGWTSKSHLTEYLRPLALISVMPDADDSWYANSDAAPQEKFEDYIAKDLIGEIDQRYRTIPTRDGRAIAGVSMGGYGAMKFALKFPQLFAFAANFSGAQIVVHDAGYVIPFGTNYNQQVRAIFGPAGAPNRLHNDIFELAQKADPAALPYLWITCGTEDGLLASNREFTALLGDKKIRYEYHESAGRHGWDYWDRQIPLMLKVLNKYIPLHQARATSPAKRAPAHVQ